VARTEALRLLEVGGWRLEVGGRRKEEGEIRDQKSEIAVSRLYRTLGPRELGFSCCLFTGVDSGQRCKADS